MTTAYTSLLGLALPVTGELSGTWGDTVNNSITSLLDSAVAGTTTLSADTTLTTTTGAANQARQAILLCTGHSANITITAPAQSKIYTVINASATYTVKIRGAGPTTGITIPVSSTATVAWNGSDFVDATNYINGNIILGSGTANGVAYLNANKQITTGSALTFDGTNLNLSIKPTNDGGYGLDIYRGNSGGYLNSWARITDASGVMSFQQIDTSSSAGFNWKLSSNSGSSFTTPMTLDASGNLALGTTSAQQTASNRTVFSLAGGSGGALMNFISSAGRMGYVFGSTTDMEIAAEGASIPIRFVTNGAEAARIDSSGQLLVGTTNANTGAKTAIKSSTCWLDSAETTATYARAGAGYLEFEAYRSTTAEIRFRTTTGGSASTNMTLDASGNLLVGTTTALAKLQLLQASNTPGAFFYKSDTGTAAALALRHDGATGATSRTMIEFGSGPSGSIVGTISSTGSATAYNTSSDYRLKENIIPMTGALAKVSALKPCTYTWKLDGSPSEGFIAHELAEVCPQAVTGEKDAIETYVDEEGNEQTRPKYQGIDTSFLVATLTAAIQEQQSIIQQLTDRITALEGK